MAEKKEELKKKLGLIKKPGCTASVETRIAEAMKLTQKRAKRFNASCHVGRGALHGEVAF